MLSRVLTQLEMPMDPTPKPAMKTQVVNDLIAVCVAHGLTDVATGEIVGVHERTVRRRRKEPEVIVKVAELVSERAAAIDLQLSDLGTAAVEVLEDAMSPESPLGYRLSGANSALRHIAASKNQAAVELRLEELETELRRVAPLLDRLEELEKAWKESR
jgi:hypothetical protein